MLTIIHKKHFCEKNSAEVNYISNFNGQMATQDIDIGVVIAS